MEVSVPGRVNLIGEHIDYHNLPVLPMAIQRRVAVTFEPLAGRKIEAKSENYPLREFSMDLLDPFPPGDWGNYLKAAVQMLERRWPLKCGIKATVTSDLPLAAGLSSSSALMTAIALALLKANSINPSIYELMELLPEGEQYVGTRGGGMDHAAVLASRAGSALFLQFAPLKFEPISIPPDWAFLVAHSLTIAQKSGAVKQEYNSRRVAGNEAFRKLQTDPDTKGLSEDERNAHSHVTSEAKRVELAVEALRADDIETFGSLLFASHASLRDQLKVSNPALDDLVVCAKEAGALGARLTGAGFGGCAIILCRRSEREATAANLVQRFYSGRPEFRLEHHLIFAEPSAGALPV
jgi:galactokinase